MVLELLILLITGKTSYKGLDSNRLQKNTSLTPIRKNRSFGAVTIRAEPRKIVLYELQLHSIMTTTIGTNSNHRKSKEVTFQR